MRIFKVYFLSTAFCLVALYGFGQSTGAYTVVNRHISFDAGGITHLDEAENAGIAWLNDKKIITGTIELDIKGRNVLQESFLGIAFHGLNDTTYEAVYFRPFNFLAADPERKAHAVQYISLPKYDWPLLREQHHNQYEKGITPAPDPDAWFHFRVVLTEKSVKVFVNNNPKPSLEVEPLTKPAGEKIGFWVGNGSPGNFKNLKIIAEK